MTDTRMTKQKGDKLTTNSMATDATAAQLAIQLHAERIKTRELRQAHERLAPDGSLSDTEKNILDSMATAIMEEIIAAPVTALEQADSYDDDTVETALELFDPTGD